MSSVTRRLERLERDTVGSFWIDVNGGNPPPPDFKGEHLIIRTGINRAPGDVPMEAQSAG